jgi:hydroxymethylbilane synthase
MKTIRAGSRDSILAVTQAEIVIRAVKEKDPGLDFEIVKIKTTGDKMQDQSLEKIGGKGLFIKEIEQALAAGDIDIAIHSYKDMPYSETDGLPIVALSERESPFDVLVLPEGACEPDKSKPIGSSSNRRSVQFGRLYEGFKIEAIRGNVPTRLSKLDRGDYSAVILAQAGLSRLSLQNRISRVFTIDEMIPSASQGIIAVQGREGEDHSYLECFHDRTSEIVSKAERKFLKTLGSDCTSPVGIFGELRKKELFLTGMYVDASGHMEKGKITGAAKDAEKLGETLARELRAKAVGK